MTKTVWVQQWEESEAGWGVRPDGASIHRTEDDLVRWCNDITKDYTGHAPESYIRPACEAYTVEMQEDDPLYLRLIEQGGVNPARPGVWITNQERPDPPDHVGGWRHGVRPRPS